MARASKLDSDKVIEAALAVAARDGWRQTSLRAIAEEAGTSLAALIAFLPSKYALFDLIARKADAIMLAEDVPAGAEESPRDRLFEVLMRRFDALQQYRDRLPTLLQDAGRDPAALLSGACVTGRSMGFALEAAGLNASGPSGMLRRKGLSAIWLAALRAWVADESPDLSRTMATLDKGLRRAENLVSLVRGRGAGGVQAQTGGI